MARIVAMPTSIRVSPRANLKRYVDYLERDDLEGTPLWQSHDPDIRALGVQWRLQEEPRLWKLSREEVRAVVMVDIEASHGVKYAKKLFINHPEVVEELAKMRRDLAHATAPEKERRAPKKSVENVVLMVILVKFLRALEKARGTKTSRNALHETVARDLGVHRLAVRRAVNRVLPAYFGKNHRLLEAALDVYRDQMDQLDCLRPRSCVRKQA
jgi:hypothetical protein